MITEEHKKWVRDHCEKYGTSYVYAKIRNNQKEFLDMNIEDLILEEIIGYILELEASGDYKPFNLHS